MEITEHIHAIKVPFHIQVAPGKTFERFVYAYLITGSKLYLIDSAVSGSEKIIFDYLQKIGRKPQDIEALIITHAHPDHIGAAKVIQKISGCSVIAYKNTRPWIEDVEKQFKERPVPGFHSLVGGSVHIDRLLRDNEEIDAGGGLVLKVLHSPGHSKCSISLFLKEDGVLFSGDAIPQENDLPIYDDVTASIESIKKLMNLSGIKHLLASWDNPRKGEDVYGMMNKGLTYLQGIHNVIREITDKEILDDPMKLCKNMVEKLGLPEIAVNPLIAMSFASHLPVLGKEKL